MQFFLLLLNELHREIFSDAAANAVHVEESLFGWPECFTTVLELTLVGALDTNELLLLECS